MDIFLEQAVAEVEYLQAVQLLECGRHGAGSLLRERVVVQVQDSEQG